MRKRGLSFVLTVVCLLAAAGCNTECENLERNKEVVRQVAAAILANDYDALDQYIVEDYKRHCQATPDVKIRSADEFVRFVEEQYLIFPDMRVDPKWLVAEGDRVAFWGTFSGTQEGAMGPFPPTSRRMVVDVGGVFLVRGGRIAELWITWDNVAGMTQLGLAPQPAGT